MNDVLRIAERWWRRFWFDFRIEPSKLALLRVGFFGVFALDMFLQISHAPRYGAGDFNVSHFMWLDGLIPMPGRSLVLTLFLLQSFLALRVMFGVAITSSVRLIAAFNGYTYFVSQVDSYQHHYLVFLLLLIACFIPWEQARQPDPDRPAAGIASWAMRLFLVQLTLLYAWAAVAKMSPHWLDGTAMQGQIQAGWIRDAIEAVFGRSGPGDPGGHAAMAKLIMLTELALAAGILWRRAWTAVWVIGVGFHLGVELAGFKIGLFSYFMLGIYVVFLPAVVTDAIVRAGEWLRDRTWGRLDARLNAMDGGSTGWVISLACVAIGAVLLTALPFDEMVGVAVAASLLGLVTQAMLLVRRPARRAEVVRSAVVHVLACLMLLGFHAKTDQAFDYYKYLGGTSRRLSDAETAKDAYRHLIEVAPNYGLAYYHLGRYTEEDKDPGGALKLYRQAQQKQPPDPRPFHAEAAILRQRGDAEGALKVLRTCHERAPAKGECALMEARTHQAAKRVDEAGEAAGRALTVAPPRSQSARQAQLILNWAQQNGRK